ncbi:hypothetical protein MGYG_04390 [Nannizzia gypsea CBS 118893]|uniref:ABC1 atypical kinase-like domain-containing protein n=1 Tax=Arthroderma gypseum (strain ATCC MYA-4604 / CBS 118893) TaxID=535722 RepID=E4UST4_ARTGP|nr:hypothetical protein MGYG_04390 [Nannizzia gypsea CBS 118893]EFR01383.1 hypothetical protein MGYG_04390 [Nannizzia gypsea CBS 118893]
MGGTKFYQNWVRDLFDDYVIWSADDGTEWQIKKKLSERASFYPAENNGELTWNGCIVKIRLQVPPEYPASLKPESRRNFASIETSHFIDMEIASLRHFNKVGSKATPRIIHLKRSLQRDHYPVPGGYIVFIIMEKVPGITLSEFWSYDLAKRDKIRAAFRETLTEICRNHGFIGDPHLGNIIYDEKKNKCWIVDYEDIYICKDRKPKTFSEHVYLYWGLASSNNYGIRW